MIYFLMYGVSHRIRTSISTLCRRASLAIGQTRQLKFWRGIRESNSGKRICSPVRQPLRQCPYKLLRLFSEIMSEIAIIPYGRNTWSDRQESNLRKLFASWLEARCSTAELRSHVLFIQIVYYIQCQRLT
jgi:hypothetical protein